MESPSVIMAKSYTDTTYQSYDGLIEAAIERNV